MTQDMANRLQWACRRGMLELDVLLGNFLAEVYSTLSISEQKNFVKLLDCSDQDLFNWLTAKETPTDAVFIDMVNRIRLHAKTRSAHKNI